VHCSSGSSIKQVKCPDTGTGTMHTLSCSRYMQSAQSLLVLSLRCTQRSGLCHSNEQ
jgi:hypothetical protein